MSAPRPSGLTIARHARRFAKRYALTIADGTEEHHDQRYKCLVHCQCEDHYYRMRECKHIEAWHVLHDRAYHRRRFVMNWLRAILSLLRLGRVFQDLGLRYRCWRVGADYKWVRRLQEEGRMAHLAGEKVLDRLLLLAVQGYRGEALIMKLRETRPDGGGV